jgi:site-specific recombinase XerD
LPKAIEIIEKYKNHQLCLRKGTLLPVISNQKMNAYLDEIGAISGVLSLINTHKARRTFASTIALNNGVPLHIVKEILGHLTIRQTEEYTITTQQSIGKEMTDLKDKLIERTAKNT